VIRRELDAGALVESDQQLSEVVAGKAPVEGLGDLVVVVLERVEAIDHRASARAARGAPSER